MGASRLRCLRNASHCRCVCRVAVWRNGHVADDLAQRELLQRINFGVGRHGVYRAVAEQEET